MRGLQTPSYEQQGVGVGCDEFGKREELGLGIKWGWGGILSNKPLFVLVSIHCVDQQRTQAPKMHNSNVASHLDSQTNLREVPPFIRKGLSS